MNCLCVDYTLVGLSRLINCNELNKKKNKITQSSIQEIVKCEDDRTQPRANIKVVLHCSLEARRKLIPLGNFILLCALVFLNVFRE